MAARRQPAVPGAHLIREAEAISAGAVAVFLALSFLSFSPDAPHPNPGRPVGHALAATVRAGAARLGRRPGAADEPSAVPRRPKLPVLLDDALEPPPEAPADNPPPIIREPERRPEASRRARRSELQEELFAEDSYRLPA